tara:strand:- start:936 stop:1766 length:831 start_codon:yes stop_codon:yes gene_type:complete
MEIKNDNLYDLNNYHKNLNINNYNEYLSKFIDIINEFLIHSSTSINIKDLKYYTFVHIRGLQTIKHIFKYLLYYTKNINLTVHHCKKAYLYYVEFISQIGEDSHSYLQLNSKDAALFVYKKTIYELNNSKMQSHKMNINEVKIFELMTSVINIYEKIIIFSLNKLKDDDNKKQQFVYIEKECLKIINKFFVEKIMYKKYIKNCCIFLNFLDFIVLKKDINLESFFSISNLFLKKIIDKNKKADIKLLDKKYSKALVNNNLEELTHVKFINWLFNFN